MYIHWKGGEAIAPTNLIHRTTEGDCTSGGGTGLFTNCPSGRFSSAVALVFQSQVFDIGTLSSTTVANSAFRFSINFANVSGGATWAVNYELWSVSTGKVGNLNVNPITGSGTVSCQQWTYNPIGGDNVFTNLTGNHYIRIVFTTTNTLNVTGNCVKVDDIWFYYGILSDVDAGTGGLTEPSYSSTTATGVANGSGQLKADISFIKSAQSSMNCSGSSSTGNDPLCKLTSVKGIYQIFRKDKSTEAVDLNYTENVSIPYQSGTYAFNKTAALFEDASYTYEHVLSYEGWQSDAKNLEWRSLKAVAPSWPTKTVTVKMINNPSLRVELSLDGISFTKTIWGDSGGGYKSDTMAVNHGQGLYVRLVLSMANSWGNADSFLCDEDYNLNSGTTCYLLADNSMSSNEKVLDGYLTYDQLTNSADYFASAVEW